MSLITVLFFKAVRIIKKKKKKKNKNLPPAPIFLKILDENLKNYLVWP